MKEQRRFMNGMCKKKEKGLRANFAVAGTLALASALALLLIPQASARSVRTAAQASETIPAPVKAYGSKNAPITLEVFADYECPSCGNFYEETLRPMINDYVASGKVYLIHRDFPLSSHMYGYEAARWANAAAQIGKFAEAEAALYGNQNYWAESGNIEKYMAAALSPEDLKRVEKLMDGCGFNVPPGSHTCALDAYIERDRALGNQIPVQATPTFVIIHKGQKFPAASGVVTWPLLKQFFDQLLSQ